MVAGERSLVQIAGLVEFLEELAGFLTEMWHLTDSDGLAGGGLLFAVDPAAQTV